MAELVGHHPVAPDCSLDSQARAHAWEKEKLENKRKMGPLFKTIYSLGVNEISLSICGGLMFESTETPQK